MAPKVTKYELEISPGRSSAAMSFLAQMDDQSRRLLKDLNGITTEELQWQPKRGANTIGMLLAHNAIVEVYWLQVATARVSEPALRKALGMGGDDDGMPLARTAGPPELLRGRPLAFFKQRLAKARGYSMRIVRDWGDADLERFVSRTRRNGDVSKQSLRWNLYHVLEHQAGHYGQILLLRHLYRDRRKK